MTVIRLAAGTAILGAALVLVAISFTALTLLIGEPFYDRIWRAVESDLASSGIDADYGFWRSIGDTLMLLLRGLGVAFAAALISLIPAVGGILGTIFAVTFTGWLLTEELTARALTARGIGRPARRELMRRHRARIVGFGIATQLCFLVPLGAVATMPAAVAGATLLARALLEARPHRSRSPPPIASANALVSTRAGRDGGRDMPARRGCRRVGWPCRTPSAIRRFAPPAAGGRRARRGRRGTRRGTR